MVSPLSLSCSNLFLFFCLFLPLFFFCHSLLPAALLSLLPPLSVFQGYSGQLQFRNDKMEIIAVSLRSSEMKWPMKKSLRTLVCCSSMHCVFVCVCFLWCMTSAHHSTFCIRVSQMQSGWVMQCNRRKGRPALLISSSPLLPTFTRRP